MKKLFLIFFCFFVFFENSFGFDIRSIQDTKNTVIDQSNILSSNEKISLEQQIEDIRTSTTAEVFLLIIPTTSGEDISALGTQIGHTLGVGKKDTDNGIVILIALEDRAWNISTGYGIEGVLPDILSHKIGEKNFALFKEEKYFQGLSQALSDIKGVIEQDPSIISKLENNTDKYGIFVPLFFIIFIFSHLFLKWLYKKKKFWIIAIIGFIGYISTLGIMIELVGNMAIIVNFITWGLGVFFGVISESTGVLSKGNGSGGGSSGRSGGGGFGGGGFGGGGSSGKW